MTNVNSWARWFLPTSLVAVVLVFGCSLAHAEPTVTAVQAYGEQKDQDIWRPLIAIIFIVVTNFVYVKYAPTPQNLKVNLTHLVVITDMAILVAIGLMDSSAILEYAKLFGVSF